MKSLDRARALLLQGVLGVCLAAPCLTAQAQDYPEYAAEPEPASDPVVTLSLSPLHLFIPILEAQLELRVSDGLGLSVFGGGGRITMHSTDGDELHFAAWEVGAQAAAYPFDVFKGFELGVEALWLHVSLEDEIGDNRISGTGAGLSIGPFLGYKWIAAVGFSVFLQAGFSALVAQAQGKNDLGQRASVDENDLLLLLNFNLGWSF
jgi:hypothetical protein